jgi:hypothetical protein
MAYHAVFDSCRTFGVEIEAFDVKQTLLRSTMQVHGLPCKVIRNLNEVPSTWGIKSEGSIEGSHPFELVSPPLSGIEGLEEVGRVLDLLEVLGAQVNSSCGLHVHWNCGDYTGKNMLSLLRLYAKFEPVIDYLVSASRRGNLNENCLSLCKDEAMQWITQLDPSEQNRAYQVSRDFQRLYSTPTKSGRHHKLNILSYLTYRTVEFRQHQGTLKREDALNWIVFTQQLVNRAKYSSVLGRPSARLTLGELLRTLRLEKQEQLSPALYGLTQWMKKRHAHFNRLGRQAKADGMILTGDFSGPYVVTWNSDQLTLNP